MKVSFISVFFLLQLIALLSCSTVLGQKTHNPSALKKNNFTRFTRKQTSRGKIWMERNMLFLRHPDANFSDARSPNIHAVELFGKRTIDSKYYINRDTPSICYAQWSSGPMHFKRNGQWITIDNRLSPKGPLRYEASSQEDPLGFDIKRKSSYILTPDGTTYFNHWKMFGKNGSKEILLAVADWSHYTIGDDGMAITNIFPGIDAEMKLSQGSIKTSFIVHANKFSKYKTLLFRDAFLNVHPGNFSFSKGLTGNGLTSSVDFRVGTGTVFHIKEGIMYQKKNPSANQFIPYFIDHNKLTLAITSDNLNAQVMMGDVVIDPLVQDVGVLKKKQINGSHSNQDCSLDTACQYDLMVPAPPGAILTDAQFSFEFTANAPCVGTDGAFSFIINGGCTSQKYLGVSPGTGPENFPNQSIILANGGSVAACLPAPVCGKQNVPFTFNFFRKCNGPDGCDGTCIEASQDLQITLVGRTFDSASLSVSGQGGCAGSPVTLTAKGYYGLAPYNYVWQGLPQFNGDSVIQVNPNNNTVYTVQVSDACPGGTGIPVFKSVNVNVTKLPTPVFTSNSPVCVGGQLILSAVPLPGISYFIKNPTTGLGGGQYASAAVFNNVTSAYSGTWIAVASDANGCTSDTASTNVVINPTLFPTATITSSATNICTGTLVTFNATAINAGSSPSYQWLVNSQKVGTNSPIYSSSSFANNDAVSCIVSASGPCAGGFDVSNIIVLTVNATGTPTFDPIGPLCQNSTPPPLPLVSKEGIVGTWSPAIINTAVFGTTTYKFTPSSPGNCSTPASLNVTIASTVTPTFPTIANAYCQNAAAPLLPTTSNEGISGSWSPSAINTADVGRTLYTFTPTGQCGTSLQIAIVINPVPVLTMPPDVSITPGASTPLNVSVTGNIVSYQWQPSVGLNSTTIEDPVASPSVTTLYTLLVTDDNRCEASDSVRVTVAGSTSKILVPNAFSPNGDGINDTWVIANLSAYPGATVDVFNRYGQLVFHSENYSSAWDGNYNGKPLPMATYYYIIDPKNNEKKIAGSVTLFK